MTVAANYGDVLDQLRAAGLIVDQLVVDGKVHRVLVEGERGKKGWYLLHEWSTSNRGVLIVGSFGFNRGNDHGTQKIELAMRDIQPDERDALRARLREDRARADAERAREAARAAARATAAWQKCTEVGESEYLTRKGVPGFGVRYSPNGALVIPMIDGAGAIHGLQIIRARKAAASDKRPEKEFWPAGLAKKGHFHLIGMPTSIVLVAEGYATGASLHAATGLPVAVAFDANNLAPVAAELHRRYRSAKILIGADDDAFAKCPDKDCAARIILADHPQTCPACGKDHGRVNTGVNAASTAALAVGGAFAVPRFADEAARRTKFTERGIKITDFNDLHALEGLHVVRAQVESTLGGLAWRVDQGKNRADPSTSTAGAGGAKQPLMPIPSVGLLLDRYSIVYGLKGALFDHHEHQLVADTDVRNICLNRYVYREWSEHPEKHIVRQSEVGFDPAGADPGITCNVWQGWPTQPKAGKCERIIELIHLLCSREPNAAALADALLKWMAYPIKNPGAKMRSSVIVHGPQGFGKNVIFEDVLGAIYGAYACTINQDAIEDRFNDWASGKLFLIADEVVSRDNSFHVKNKLKQFISGPSIRINPKNMAAYEERNHVNMVFLSNESRPLVLEEDDRRHFVLYTPAAQPAEFYLAIRDEIRAGGIAAFHDYLLNQVDLEGVDEHFKPPMTQAKMALIERSLDTTVAFYYAMYDGECFDIEPMPCLADDLYALYSRWCTANGHKRASSRILHDAMIRKEIKFSRERYLDEYSTIKGPHSICHLTVSAKAALDGIPGECPPGKDRKAWLGQCITRFGKQVDGGEKKMRATA